MLSRFSVVADENTILLIPNNQYQLNCIAINRRNGNCKAHHSNQFDFRAVTDKMDEKDNVGGRKRVKIQQQQHSFHNVDGIHEHQDLPDPDLGFDSKYAIETNKQPNVSFAFAMDPSFRVLWGFDSVSKTMMFFNVIASEIAPCSEVPFIQLSSDCF